MFEVISRDLTGAFITFVTLILKGRLNGLFELGPGEFTLVQLCLSERWNRGDLFLCWTSLPFLNVLVLGFRFGRRRKQLSLELRSGAEASRPLRLLGQIWTRRGSKETFLLFILSLRMLPHSIEHFIQLGLFGREPA